MSSLPAPPTYQASMDEEGTVVYFKVGTFTSEMTSFLLMQTSPSVQDAEEELTFGEGAPVQVTTDPPASTPSGPSTIPQSSLFGRLSGYAEQLLTYAYSQDKVSTIKVSLILMLIIKSEQMMPELVGSSLLTEEDCHILHVSLKHPLVPCTTSQPSTRSIPSYYYQQHIYIL